jgi:cell wall-associated NlpC family hydrolase
MKQDHPGPCFPKSVARKRVALDGVSRPYDARVRAIRPDLADVALADIYFAPHYAMPVARMCVSPSVMLRGTPDGAASAVSELLHGEAFWMLEARAGWAWGFCGHDHYVGYVPLDALGDPAQLHYRTSGHAPLFARADIKAPVLRVYPPFARLAGQCDGDFLGTGDGFVHRRHVRPLADTVEADWTAVAERAIGAPYVWGGRGGLGHDCSGLVQVALAACGIAAPRDTDQQLAALGAPIPDGAPPRRGDIMFFPGHVGLMADERRLVHANAHWMAVTLEPLDDVVARLADKYEQPVTGRRRITP